MFFGSPIKPDLALRMKSQPILRSDEQIDDSNPIRGPLSGKVCRALVGPHHEQAQGAWCRSGTTRPSPTKLRGHHAQHRDLEVLGVLRHLRQRMACTSATRWAAADANAPPHRKAQTKLSEDCCAPVKRTGLQHLVAGACFRAQNNAVVFSFPKGHSVRHSDALASLRGAACVNIHQDALGMRQCLEVDSFHGAVNGLLTACPREVWDVGRPLGRVIADDHAWLEFPQDLPAARFLHDFVGHVG
mmetsp:Transcript_4609/g.10940  ORF Transcript_4609/g.10940 Transcript_4609/m.10940 type:complete len:244 (+) Transcript_4609:3455-4186(+)